MEKLEKQPEQQKQVSLEQLREKLLLIYGDSDKYKKLVEFAGELEAKYGDCEDYRLYLLLIGCTPPQEPPKMDFPGENSVEKFINSL